MPRLLRRIFSRVSLLFLFTVAIPTILAGIYYGRIASDIFISESHFLVRTPQRSAGSHFGQLLQNTGLSRPQDESSAVQDFILSRDALSRLENEFGLSKSFSSQQIDRISRFGGLDWDCSFEALHRYYQRRVTVNLDSASSILTLRVEAFSPEEAYKINCMLLEMSEELINQLNRRSRLDMIQFAATEVKQAESRAREASIAVSAYRNTKGIFDPKQQSGLQLQGVSKLQEELISNRTHLAQIQTASPHSPAVPVLQQRIKTLNAEITSETAKVAGSELSLSMHGPEYERLCLDQVFADKSLTTALETLQNARNEALRKQLYLERIVHPNLPDVAVEPRGLRMFLGISVLGFISWAVLALLLAGVREHRE